MFIDAPAVHAAPEPTPEAPPPPQVLSPKVAPELPPLVPLWMVVAGVWGLIALLVVLLLSR